MKQERTIAIKEKEAELYNRYLTEKLDFWEEGKVTTLITKFGEDIEVQITLYQGMYPKVEATFHKKKEQLLSVTVDKTILGTYAFIDGDTEYRVYVVTIEEIEKEEARRKKRPAAVFIPAKGIDVQSEEINERKRYWLFGWDDHYPKGGIEQVELKFSNEQEIESWFANGIDYISEKYQVLDMETENTLNSADMRSKNFGSEEQEELKAWLYSLPLEM